MTALSIAVPAYNQGSYLGATLDSLLAQDLAPHEIVVSDNHSTDDTAAVLDRYADRVRVVRPPTHLSVLEHWDWLVGQLTGDWFSIMSSDDLAGPAFVATLVGAADSDADAAVAHAGFDVIDAAGARTATSVSLRTRPVRRAPDTLREQLTGPLVNLSASATRRRVWEAVGGFATGCSFLGDWTLWIQATLHGTFTYAPQVVSSYRVYERPETLRSRAEPSSRDLAHVYGELLPVVAPEAGVTADEVRAAFRTRLRRHLSAASQVLDADGRLAVAEPLRLLAAEAGEAGLLHRFEVSGLPPEPYFRYSRTRRLARPLLDRVRSARSRVGR